MLNLPDTVRVTVETSNLKLINALLNLIQTSAGFKPDCLSIGKILGKDNGLSARTSKEDALSQRRAIKRKHQIYSIMSVLIQILLPLFISLTTLCTAELRCLPSTQGYVELVPAHCAYIIAHVPSAPFHPSQPQGQLLSSSSAFLPNVEFRHKSCVIVLNSFSNSFSPYRYPRNLPSTDIRVPESTVVQRWSTLKSAAEEVQTECVMQGHWGAYNIEDLSTAGRHFHVSILAYLPRQRSIADKKITTMRSFLRMSGEGLGLSQADIIELAQTFFEDPWQWETYDI